MRRSLSFLLSFSLLLQNFSPLAFLPVYADDSSPSADTVEITPTPETTPEPTPTPTTEPTAEITPSATPDPTPETTPDPTPIITPEATPSPTLETTPTPEITPTSAQEVKDESMSNTDSQAPPQENLTSNDQTDPSSVTPQSLIIAAEIENLETTPTLSTDKSDYFPTEIVHITGVNFAPNTDYKLHISSSDSPFVSIYINVTSNENGVISYSYQLDGRYRPNYSIEALDSENNVIVSYLFTDADPQITYDSFEGEISPISSNNWTKGNISGYKEGDTIRFRLNLDSDPGTLSGDLFVGFTSAPACRFFKYQDPTSISLDFDRNTNAIDSGSGFSVNYIGLSQNGSDGVAHFAISSTAAKAVRLNFTLQVDDSAAGCASGSSQHVQVDRATGNIKDSGAKALPIPASAVVPVTDITISKTGPSTASIGETLSYNLQVTNLDANTSAQSVSISDTLPAGTTFISASGATCSSNSGTITCNLGTMAGGSSKTVTINVSVNNNESICGTTITNTATLATTTIESDLTNNSSSASTSINSCSGTVELQKVWIGIGGQTTLNIGTTAGDDDIDSQITGVSGASPLTTGSISVPTGTYYVSETGGLEGYSSSLTCTDNASPVTPGTSNSVYVSAGHTLICTFTNTKLGLSVTKTANPTSLTEPGGVSTFTVRVSNPNAVSVNLTSLTDDVYGDLNTQDNCSIPQTIAASDYYECSFTKPISGNSDTTHTNTVTAVASGVTATDSETVTITDVNPSVEVTKTANPTSLPETGGNVTYTYTVKNTSNAESATITALSDDKLGVLAGDADCYVGLSLSTGASCSFDVNTSVSGNSGSSLTNIFTATVRDDENNSVSDTDDATVSFSDVLPTVELTKSVDQNSRPEPGGDFVFTLSIKNTSSEPVSITSLSDSYTLSDQCNNLVGTSLSAGATTTCSYTVSKSLVGSYLNTANVVVTDDDGSTANDSDSENISVTDVKPTINVSKTASVSTLSEPGGTITYTFTVANTSSVDSVTITKLYDDKFGDLIGDSDCQLNTVLGVGESCSFSLNKSLLFDAGYIHTNVFSAEAKDDENNIATDSDDETVTINNVDPSITIDKTVTPSELPEPGGIFTYTLTVQNTSVEDVTITSLTDSNTLSQECLDLVGDILTPNQIVTCSYTVTRSESGTYDNTATVVVSDNETKTATDSDSESVKVIDVTPSITVTKTANVSSVNYPGANVLYTFMVQNNSVESVTITTISDDKFTLVGDADCQVGVVLAAGDSCSFSETHYVSGPVETTHRNTVIVKAVDNEKNEASSSDYEDVRINFVEVSISGQKFNDYNGNGQKDTSESGISGWTINLLNTSNEVIATTTTDSSGNFTFSDLGSGIYRVREVGQSGWTQTTDNPTDITVASGQNVSGIDFGNQMRGSITIIKDAVSNNAQDFQFTSSKLGTFYLDDDSNATLSNEHTFSNLGSDSYTITESETSGWKLSDITCSAKDAEISLVSRSVSLNIDEPGEAITCTFKNSQLGSIQIVKNTTGSNGKFSFTTTGGSTLPSGFELTTINGTNSVTYTGIDPDLTYSITETVPDGWTQTSATCTGTNTPSKITPNAGEAVVCTFENTRDTGSITVKKIIDVDGNSETVEDQTLGAYWQFDVDGDSQDTTDASADLTTSAGLLSFSQLKSGTYSIVETTQKGYTLASAYCSNESGVFDKVDSLSGVSVDKDEDVTCTFINKPNGTIHGYKWHDEDMDGEFGEGEDKLSGWTINLYDWNTELRGFNTTPIKSMVTDSGETHFGWYWFENLTPGRYKVCEENQEGWSQTYPDNCHLLSLPDGNSSGFEQMDNAVSGPVYKFGNVQLAELTVIKYSDDNQNGKMDEDEGTLEGWEINLSEIESDGDSKMTDEDGSALFENIIPGEYELSETQQDGWYQSNIYCPNLDDRRENLFSQEFYTGSRNISLSAGDQYTCYIGNYSDPEIHISKYNDSVGSKTPGDSVTFRILLNILKAKVNNLTVKDLLPKGFAYRAGSYQVKINGSIVSISEPEYHSPGKWEIGSVNEGDEIELLYIADISSDTLPGDYLDAVWAVGKSLAGDNVLALANEDSYVDEHFAGTTVAIVKDQTRTDDYGVEKKEEVVGQVLGATTSLPATGANELWIIVSIASLYLGIKLVTSAKSK